MIDQMKATNLYTGKHGERFVIYVTAALTQLKRVIAPTQRVIESIVFFEMVN